MDHQKKDSNCQHINIYYKCHEEISFYILGQCAWTPDTRCPWCRGAAKGRGRIPEVDLDILTFINRPHQSLHDAVLGGCTKSLRHFLENGANVNERDTNGNTPLLLGVCVEQEEIYNSIVELLIKHGADVNAYNKGFTPLYNAVFYKREESVKMLLAAGAWLRPSYRNELHLLSEMGGSNILELILRDNRCTPEVINTPDKDGQTALHIAAQFYHRNCLKMLIKKGGNLAAVNNEGETVVDIIFEQFVNPEKIVNEWLNENIVVVQAGKYKHLYDIDFSILAPKACERQMEVISHLLLAATEEQKTDFIQHPLIELYLLLKWKRICYFFYLWIVAYAVFAVSIGIYTSLVIIHHEISRFFKRAVKCTLIISASGLLCHAILQCILVRRNYLRRYEMWMNLICTSLSLAVAVTTDDISGGPNINSNSGLGGAVKVLLVMGAEAKGAPKRCHYKFQNKKTRMIGKSALIKEMSEQSQIMVTEAEAYTPNWVLHVTSIAVLLAWIELMLLIGRLPSLGYYALMFSAVLQNVVKTEVCVTVQCMVGIANVGANRFDVSSKTDIRRKTSNVGTNIGANTIFSIHTLDERTLAPMCGAGVLLAFLCLVIGFAFSFSIQFHNYDQFADPWRALVKTAVMMMGEFEYADLFADEAVAPYRLPATSRFIFLAFIILTSIVLMNLMVGMAVSDIQELQRLGYAKKLEKQAEFLCQLEKVISSRQLNSKYVPAIIKRVFARRSFINTKYVVKTSAEFQRDENIPRRLIGLYGKGLT
ncbi:hypothetical protein NQ317_012582 [Molorchus minor]|uniref:Ion transport domain-containing protein n=1 Tax=Molorchus minor TaxID=1323400 RepID=A0ABQ9J283_9CUCU|nr:hypothetical protein NQ317_012582 [Molorchus minor]